jgi:hypothetical protein
MEGSAQVAPRLRPVRASQERELRIFTDLWCRATLRVAIVRGYVSSRMVALPVDEHHLGDSLPPHQSGHPRLPARDARVRPHIAGGPHTAPPRHASEPVARALSLICTALAFVLFFALIAEIGPARSTVITYFNPAVAIVLGVVVLGEPFTAGLALGFPLIVVGSVLATGRRVAPV